MTRSSALKYTMICSLLFAAGGVSIGVTALMHHTAHAAAQTPVTQPVNQPTPYTEPADVSFGGYCVTQTEYDNIVQGWNALTDTQRTAYAAKQSGDRIADYANDKHPGWATGLRKAQTSDVTKPPCST